MGAAQYRPSRRKYLNIWATLMLSGRSSLLIKLWVFLIWSSIDQEACLSWWFFILSIPLWAAPNKIEKMKWLELRSHISHRIRKHVRMKEWKRCTRKSIERWDWYLYSHTRTSIYGNVSFNKNDPFEFGFVAFLYLQHSTCVEVFYSVKIVENTKPFSLQACTPAAQNFDPKINFLELHYTGCCDTEVATVSRFNCKKSCPQ